MLCIMGISIMRGANENEMVGETKKSIKIKYGIHTTYLPKSKIKFEVLDEGNKVQMKLPLWLYRKTFV